MSQPDYIVSLSADMTAIEESTALNNELNAATTCTDVRVALERHRQHYLSMSMPERASLNNKVKKLFEVLR
jgi:hypothetical protein